MNEEEKIKLFERLTVAWEFSQNKDLPCILITYKDENGKTYCINGNFRQEGIINIGEEYRKSRSIGIMDKIPFQKCTYTFSDEEIAEIKKSATAYKKQTIQIVDNDDTLTVYESTDGSCWTCRKCGLSFECKVHSAHYCPNCGRKIYNFIKE